ncbi:MAG: O-antigen ligase family protein [Clostridia bacterium]
MGKRNKRKKSNKIGMDQRIWPLLLWAFVPVLVLYRHVTYDPKMKELFVVSGESTVDYFFAAKAIAICVLGAFMVFLLFWKRDKQQPLLVRERLRYHIPIAAYMLLILLSALVCPYRSISFFGMYGRYEGAFVLVSYLVLVLYAMETLRQEKQVRTVILALYWACIPIAVIGFIQASGFNPFTNDTVLRFLGTSTAIEMYNPFGEKTVYSTLGNPNYVGHFFAMLLPLCLGGVFAFKEIKFRLLSFIAFVLSLVMLALGRSSAGFIAFFVSFLLFFILSFSSLVTRRKIWMPGMALLVVLVVAGAFVMKTSVGDKVRELDFIQQEKSILAGEWGGPYIHDMSISQDGFQVDANMGYLRIERKEGAFLFLDRDGQELNHVIQGNAYRFTDDDYSKSFRMDTDGENTNVLHMGSSGYGIRVEFYTIDDFFVGIKGPVNTVVTEVKPSRTPDYMKGYEYLATGRGYLWSVTLTMLPDTALLGKGPDTFRIYFDQYDLIGKLNIMSGTDRIIDKPHNIFMLIGYQTGLLSLLAFLSLTGAYLLTGFKAYGLRRKQGFNDIMGTAVLCSAIAFLVAGLSADSTVGVTPVFYLILGIGIALVELKKKSPSTKEKPFDNKKEL